MKVQDIGHAIVKRAWIVIALVLVAALVAAIVAQVQSPVYKVEIAVSTSAPINPVNKQPDATAMIGLAALTPAIANYTESIDVANATSLLLGPCGRSATAARPPLGKSMGLRILSLSKDARSSTPWLEVKAWFNR